MDGIDTGPALEKWVYTSWHNQFSAFRQANIGSKLVTLDDKIQLPNNSVLHLIDKLLSPTVDTVLPDINNPLITNEKFQLYLDIIQDIPTTGLFPITDTFRFRPVRFTNDIRHFYIEHRNIKRPSSLDMMLNRSNTLPIISYNEVLTAQVISGGPFTYYRHFDLVFRTILNTISTISGKHNFLQIPLSRTVYTKTQFVQTFDEISYKTVRIRNDVSFLFLIHLVNFMSKTATTSYFNQLPQETLDTLNLILTAGNQAIVLNLGDWKHILDSRKDNNLYQLVIRHINTLKLAGYADKDITHLDDTEYEKLVTDVAPDDSHVADDEHSSQLDKTLGTPRQLHPQISGPDKKQTTIVQDKRHINELNTVDSKVSVLPITNEVEADFEEKERGVRPSLNNMKNYGIFIGTTLVGVCRVNTNPKEYEHGAWISYLGIDVAHRNTGLGSQLLAFIIDKYPQLRATTGSRSDEWMGLLLTKLGFVILSNIRGVTIWEHLSTNDSHKSEVSPLQPDKIKDPTPHPNEPPTTSHPLPTVVVNPVAQLPKSHDSLIEIIDHGAYESIMAATHLTEDQKVAAMQASQLYKTLLIDDKTIEEHLQQTAEPTITNNHLSFLENKVVDKSMLSSSAIDLDKHYLDHLMAKDLASVVAQMTANGMFLIKTEQRDDVTQLSRIRHYKLVYQDVLGRKHTVTFKLPIVSSDGTIMINGIASRMIKQQVNLPICKINDHRVSLASSYNKTLVERLGTRAHNFNAYITKYIASVYKAKVGLELSYGSLTTSAKLPYDYSSLARKYSTLSFQGPIISGIDRAQYRFTFDYDNRFDMDTTISTETIHKNTLLDAYRHKLDDLERSYGVYCGTARRNGHTYRMFFGQDNLIRFIGPNRGKTPVSDQNTFISLFFGCFAEIVDPPAPLSEWTELKILDKNFPIVFILGYEYGLQRVLDHIQLSYQFLPTNTRINRTATTLVVPFADGNLVFDRYPLVHSFIMAGLLKFKTKSYEFSKFNTQDTYYSILQDAGISLNYLKGISDFFKLFIDPITRDVLLRMHEPTEVGRLLVRATEMLTTEDAIPSSSMRNHRLRGYERFTTTLYNEMARAFASYSKQRGNRKTYSINPEAVFLRLIQDQTLHIIEEINPIENIKEKHSITYTGGGGRTAQSFVVEDRRFPEDGIGVLSEATPDNGKVSINASISADPLISNIRGMFDLDGVDPDKLEPSQVLSVPALLMPCSTNDDGKRVGMVSIQLKHHIPSEYSETNRVRTGYETVVAHRTGETFACTAKKDGIVEEVDDNLGIIKVSYDEDDIPTLDPKKIVSDTAEQKKLVSSIKNRLENNQPILITTQHTNFKLHDSYKLGDTLLKVVDVIPLPNAYILSPQKTPEELLRMMSSIRYETFTDENDYIVKTPDKVLRQKEGVCYDQVELERDYFMKWGVSFKTFFAYTGSVRDNPTHTFLVYHDHKGYFWFENSWGAMRGIHGPFGSFNTAVDTVRSSLEKDWKKREVKVVEYTRPDNYFSLNLNQFGEKIISQQSKPSQPNPISIAKLMPVTHNHADDIDIFKFGTKFSSAAGSFVKQVVVCNVKQGERFKRGDVLAYNSGFFELDQFDTKQVTWKHGVMANITLMECNDTIEDSDAITYEFSKRMSTAASHLRTLSINSNTIIKNLKPVGTEVQTTDLLCTLEDADIAAMSESDLSNSAAFDLLTSLNRKAPKARYHGKISEIDILYACPVSKMHPSLAAIANKIDADKLALSKAAEHTHKSSEYAGPSRVPVGTKYRGVEFEEDTVLLLFYISEEIEHNAGDKLVLGSQAKSVCASVIEKPIYTESGVPIDLLFSGRSINARIITSPTTVGFVNRILQELERQVVKLYSES